MSSLTRGHGHAYTYHAPQLPRAVGGAAFAVHHDARWHEYDVKLKFDYPLHQIRLDPCAGAGHLEIDRLRLRDAKGKLVREWTFGTP